MRFDLLEIAVKIALFFVPFLFAISFHEFAHGFVAKLKGDRTAEQMGRLSMSPLAHVDWLGTVALPIIAIITQLPLFGWAKPVPVNPRNLRDPKNDMFWVALAGPLSNIFLFLVGLFLIFVLSQVNIGSASAALAQMLIMFLYINLYLAIFNLLPLHPLDGGKIFQRFLPFEANRWLEENQSTLNMILFVLIIIGGLRYMAMPVDFIVRHSLALIPSGGL
ncbi:MAG: site-2 protease family protein [Bdellovibrionales bacterium]|nr:site-2 protease family protein [Bdellovibrionales bacterium]